MPTGDPDRLISASEVERWSYCPLSWQLERKRSGEDRTVLDPGIKKHMEIGERARGAMKAQKGARDILSISWTYIAFSSVLLFMALSLILLSGAGPLTTFLWRSIVVAVSLVLVILSVAIYLLRSFNRMRGQRGSVRDAVREIRSSGWARSGMPIVFYIYGIVLLLNGVVLLRPLGIGPEDVLTFLLFSLLFLYVVLFISMVISFSTRSPYSKRMKTRLPTLLAFMIILLLSTLIMLLSKAIEMEGVLGYMLLFMSLLWFIGAIVYDIVIRTRPGGRKRRKMGREDLPIATMALLASVFTATIFLERSGNLENYTFLTIMISVMWLVGAFYFFMKGSSDRRSAEQMMENLSLPKKAEVVDLHDLKGGRGKPLTSRRHFLVGAPDLILSEDGFKVPVEIKTGRVPPKPHFSHVMQLGAYLILTDTNFSQSTPYGYIEYVPSKDSKERFKVEWDMMTKALVLSKISEIRDAERTGVVHRNHMREGKCRSCSRRIGCPEKLA